LANLASWFCSPGWHDGAGVSELEIATQGDFGYSLGAMCPQNRRVRQAPPQVTALSDPEEEILGYMRLGCSLWGSAMMAGRYVGEVEDMIRHGEEDPGGRYGQFSREARQLESARQANETLSGQYYSRRHRIGQQNGNGSGNGSHGNGSGGPNGQHLLSWDDL
jgi:hypothetical protein